MTFTWQQQPFESKEIEYLIEKLSSLEYGKEMYISVRFLQSAIDEENDLRKRKYTASLADNVNSSKFVSEMFNKHGLVAVNPEKPVQPVDAVKDFNYYMKDSWLEMSYDPEKDWYTVWRSRP